MGTVEKIKDALEENPIARRFFCDASIDDMHSAKAVFDEIAAERGISLHDYYLIQDALNELEEAQ